MIKRTRWRIVPGIPPGAAASPARRIICPGQSTIVRNVDAMRARNHVLSASLQCLVRQKRPSRVADSLCDLRGEIHSVQSSKSS